MTRHIQYFAALSALCVFCLFAPVKAARAAIDDAGKKQLEAVFSDLLQRYKTATEANESELDMEGDLMVEPAGTYYAVTLPHLTLRKPDKTYTEIGMIAINAMPGDGPGQWKMTVALPTPIVHFDENATPDVTVNIEGQNFVGVWNESIKNLTRINAQYKNIRIEQHDESATITIPDLRMVYDLTQNGKDLWSGPANITANDIQMAFAKTGATAQIKQMDISSTVKDYSPQAAMAYQEKLDALVESYKAGDTPSASGDHAMGFFNLFSDMFSNAWDSFDVNVAMKGFNITRPPLPGSEAGQMTLNDAAFGFGMSGFRSGLVNMALKAGYNGFSLTPKNDEYAEATPDHANIELSLNNLPYKDLVELGRTTVQNSVQNPNAGQFAMLSVVGTLPQLLTKSKSNLTLKDTTIGGNAYDILANAVFTADMQAALGAVGTAQAQIYGLDNLLTLVTNASNDPNLDPDKKEKVQNTLAGLTIFKMVGQMGKDKQGRDVRTYNLELTPQGQAMLNGTDMQMLMQATGGKDDAP